MDLYLKKLYFISTFSCCVFIFRCVLEKKKETLIFISHKKSALSQAFLLLLFSEEKKINIHKMYNILFHVNLEQAIKQVKYIY